MSKIKKYDEKSIQVLEGLEAVIKRPGMYIGSVDISGMHHLVWEIVDNAIDEALAGFCNQIKVNIKKDGSISVEDNGRGIPTGMHKKGKTTPEIIFTVLHAGGKFDSSTYKTSGGLHGVGSSVVNALSDFMNVTIFRDKKVHEIKFYQGGKIYQPLKCIGSSSKMGTIVHFKPSKTIFKDLQFSYKTLAERLRESAFLINNLTIILEDERVSKKDIFVFQNGLEEFIKYVNKNKNCITPIIIFKGVKDKIELEVAMQYTDDEIETSIAFANNVKTIEGGTHVIGLKTALTKTINDYARSQNILKEKAKNFDGSDIREGLTTIISVRVPENLIQYEGQTKSKLSTNEVKFVVDDLITKQMSFWLQENKKIALDIINKINDSRLAREAVKNARQQIRDQKQEQQQRQRILITKLTPAQSRNIHRNELFIVEGDSAGGTAKSGRDRVFQAILPLKGKVINAEKTKMTELLKNDEIMMIINAIGGGYGSNFRLKDVQYNKIIIMTDADTDGAHIQILLLTFFYRYMKQLIENEKIYLALPPLFKISRIKNGKKMMKYLWTEAELKQELKMGKCEIQRYKGLGEMNADQLWDTTMDPSQRQLIKVTGNNKVQINKRIITLMGDDPEKRRKWIEDNIKFTLEDNFLNSI